MPLDIPKGIQYSNWKQSPEEDRENLEFCVFYMLEQDEPIISFDRGRELLGFNIYQMRAWYEDYVKKIKG